MSRAEPGRCATSKDKITVKEKSHRALELRKTGMNYRDIAAEMKISKSSAYNYIVKELEMLRKSCQEEAADVRDMELQRLDELWGVAQVAALAGDLPAIDRCLRIQERRAKLLGLDAPAKSEITANTQQTEVTIYVPDNGRNDTD